MRRSINSSVPGRDSNSLASMVECILNPPTGEVLVCLGNVAKDLQLKKLKISKSLRVDSGRWNERTSVSGRSYVRELR